MKEKDVTNNSDMEAAKSEKVPEDEKNGNQEPAKETSDTKPKREAERKPEVAKTNKKKKETRVVVDKELLEAFRFFDRNRVGYIRVEDMRLIIHNLGKFISHRDVKALSRNLTAEKSSIGPNCPTQSYEFGGNTWDHNNHRWSAKKSILCTFRCWKCQRPGHLADDYLAFTSISQAASSGETCSQICEANRRNGLPNTFLLEFDWMFVATKGVFAWSQTKAMGKWPRRMDMN